MWISVCNETLVYSLNCLLLQALYVHQSDSYSIHWPIKRGCLNLHDGPGGTITAVLADLETIIGTALRSSLDISLHTLKVKFFSVHINSFGELPCFLIVVAEIVQSFLLAASYLI